MAPAVRMQRNRKLLELWNYSCDLKTSLWHNRLVRDLTWTSIKLLVVWRAGGVCQQASVCSLTLVFWFLPDLQLSAKSSSRTTTTERGIEPTDSLWTWGGGQQTHTDQKLFSFTKTWVTCITALPALVSWSPGSPCRQQARIRLTDRWICGSCSRQDWDKIPVGQKYKTVQNQPAPETHDDTLCTGIPAHIQEPVRDEEGTETENRVTFKNNYTPVPCAQPKDQSWHAT